MKMVQSYTKNGLFLIRSKKKKKKWVIVTQFPKSQKTEAAAQRCSVKKVFLEISQSSQENTCARVSF